MEETEDGFVISEYDMQLRGAGDFFGTRQSGLPEFRIADLLQDQHILEKARNAAFKLIEGDPELVGGENADMKVYFERFVLKKGLRLSRIG